MTSALSVDVENAFRDLHEEAALLVRALEQMNSALGQADDAMVWLQIAGLAAGCEKLYGGCERIMHMLVQRIDGDVIEKTSSWHSVLLNRVARPFPGVRDAVISHSCRDGLDRFRAFRHRVRNHYGMNLDRTIVMERAGEFGAVLDRFHMEVSAFLAAQKSLP